MSSTPKRLVILISGRGSNMLSLLEACRRGDINGHVAAVVSNRADAGGLEHARQAGVETAVVDHTAFPDREAFDRELYRVVSAFQPDLVILAGFMRILTDAFVAPLTGRLLNIHPSLLPKYPGLNTHQRAIDAGDREGGATVHFVTGELDGGPAIIHARVPIHTGDSAADLAARVLEKEHRIYVEAVRLICEGKIAYSATGGVLLDGRPLPPEGMDFDEPWEA